MDWVCLCLTDSVSEAVVHKSRGSPAGLQDAAHAVGRWHRLLPWKGECHVEGKTDAYKVGLFLVGAGEIHSNVDNEET